MAITSLAGVVHEAPQPIDRHLSQKLDEFRTARSNHLGYPYNLAFPIGASGQFAGFLVNNLGDPYTGSHYATETCDLEREVVAWFMKLWECQDADQFWGSVGASGTEGNIWALYLAREAQPEGVLLYSQDAHYSIPKAARILRMASVCVDSEANGEISMRSFAEKIRAQGGRPIIVALNCGTTVKGAHDDIESTLNVLERHGYGRARRFVHVDGALNAMVLPFDATAPRSIRPSFRSGIDSLSASGHKMVGTPMPCGVLVTLRSHIRRVSSAVSYLRTNDTTLMGSRNGHAVLALWERINRHGYSGFARDVAGCLERADRMYRALIAEHVPALLNPHSITVVFPEPSAGLVKKYQLACHQGLAHAVVMPNVSDRLTDTFISDYLCWWRVAQARPVDELTREGAGR